MLKLVSLNGTQTTQSLYQPSAAHLALSKCLRYINNVLNLDAEISKFDSSSSSYQLLKKLSETQNSIEFQGCIFLPIKSCNKQLWGFIKVNSLDRTIPAVKIKKALSAIESIMGSDIEPVENSSSKKHFSALLLQAEENDAYRFSLDQFNDGNFTSFINLSEWLLHKQPFSLKYLRGFKNSLFFVPELAKLTKAQRTTLALYSMLPPSIKQSSLIICSKLDKKNLTTLFENEHGFIGEFLTKEVKMKIGNKKHF